MGSRSEDLWPLLREIWANQSGENESVEAYRYVFDLRNRLEDICKMVHDNLSAAQLRHKSHFDKREKPRSQVMKCC